MIKSYLPSKYNTWAILILIFLVLTKNYKFLIPVILVHTFFYLILRKNPNRFRDDHTTTKGIIFSPCNGKIVNIEKGISHVAYGDNLIEIQIAIPWWSEMGIFMPLSAEIRNIIVHKGRSFFRFQKASEVVGTSIGKGLSISLDNRGECVGMTLYKCRLGLWPDILVMPGDRGGRRVNIGYFPFGGTLILYLPEKYEILIKENEIINAGESIIAMLPE
jgi:phosphatidylserine decarboxylase